MSAAIDPEGQLLISCGADEAVKVWELHTGELLHSLEHSDWVWSVDVSADGRLIAGAGEDGMVKVWELKTGELLHTIPGHSGPALSVAVSPDGQLLFSSGADNRIKVWNLETGGLMNVLSGHSKEVSAIAVSPDGLLLASGGHDRVIMVWGKVGPDGKLVIGSRHDESRDIEDETEEEEKLVSVDSVNHDQSVQDQHSSNVRREGRSITKPSIDELIQICDKYHGPRFYVGDAIPEELLSVARSRFPIPADERVAALVDTSTRFRKGQGLAICEAGLRLLRWQSDIPRVARRRFLEWRNFAEVSIKGRPPRLGSMYRVEIGKDNMFYAWDRDMHHDELTQLLFEIQRAAVRYRRGER